MKERKKIRSVFPRAESVTFWRCAYKASSILVKVCSACSKKPKTMDRLNSRSSSSSSISNICSKVKASMLSPRSGGPTESPSSLCGARVSQYAFVERIRSSQEGLAYPILSFMTRSIRHFRISAEQSTTRTSVKKWNTAEGGFQVSGGVV